MFFTFDHGQALAVMGNHEYNALAYATPDARDASQYLRQHDDRHTSQHQAFLNEVGFGMNQIFLTGARNLVNRLKRQTRLLYFLLFHLFLSNPYRHRACTAQSFGVCDTRYLSCDFPRVL